MSCLPGHKGGKCFCNSEAPLFDEIWRKIYMAGNDSVEVKSGASLRKHGHPRVFEIYDQLADLHDRKNKDYASGMEQGPLGNFERVAAIASLYKGMDWDSPFGVALFYALKQLDAALVLRATKKRSVTGEPIPERLKDVANYAVIAMVLAEMDEAKAEG